MNSKKLWGLVLMQFYMANLLKLVGKIKLKIMLEAFR